MFLSKYIKQPIIIFGFGRCGSTIISEILFQHQKLAWISNYQQKFPSSSRINLLRCIFDNQYWYFSGQKEQLNKVSFFNKYIFKPGESYRFWDYITGRDFSRKFLWRISENEIKRDEIRSFFSDLVRYQNRRRLSFKITGPSRLNYLTSLFPDAKFIYIRRDPLPNIRSLLNVEFYQNRKKTLWWNRDVYNELEIQMAEKWKDKPELIAALQYYKVHEIFLKEKSDLNLEENILEILYEDFINNPTEVIVEMLQFSNLEMDNRVKKLLSTINVYNRNKKKEYYISQKMDSSVNKIALKGVYNDLKI